MLPVAQKINMVRTDGQSGGGDVRNPRLKQAGKSQNSNGYCKKSIISQQKMAEHSGMSFTE
jgi:hypothetical protein